MSLRPSDPVQIGQYRLTDRLGAGGMGVVYLGVAPDGSLVAVKVLRPELADDPEFRRRFGREVTVLMRVKGLCTVRVIEADTDSQLPFMVTEYADGPSLAEYIDTYGCLKADMLYGLATGLAEALTVIHAAGIVHRDLKPSNVILAQGGPKVIDFGIAQALDATSVTKTGMMVGSPGFMAPEQITGRPGPAADIFVWGVTIGYAAVGHSPFGTGNTNAVLYRVLYADPDIAAIPDALKPLVAAALAKDPQDRPTARELLDRLTSMPARSAPVTERPYDVPTQTVLARTWQETGPHTDWSPAHQPQPSASRSQPEPSHQPQPSLPAARGSLLLDSEPRGTRPASRRVSRRMTIGASAVAVVLAVAAALVAFLPSDHSPEGHLVGNQAGLSTVKMTALPGYADQQPRGVFQTISRIFSSGGTMVTTGAQTNQAGRDARQQFFVSTDGGTTWHVAPVHRPGGSQPPLGYLAGLITGGLHGWLAEGQDAIWTSPNGLSWTLAATHGITSQPGDSIDVVSNTADGFLAAGHQQTSSGAQAVVWTSQDGLTWQRKTASQLGLTSAGGVAQNIHYATSQGNDTVISDKSSVWLSTDGGATWTPVTIPADHRAQGTISGVSFDSSGLIAVRPSQTRNGGIAYFSPNGQAWQYAGTINSADGWTPDVVKGGNDGFVVTGLTDKHQFVAYRSTGTGTSWLPTGSLGNTSSVASVFPAVAPDGDVVAVGATNATAISQQAVLVEANTAGKVWSRPLTAIPAVTVTSTAVAGGVQLAVGSADGYPAIWKKSTSGSWALVTSPSLVSGTTGLAQFTSVTHGSAGWLAVGFPGPVILTSADGSTWKAASGSMVRDLPGVVSISAAAGRAGYVIAGSELKTGGGYAAILYWSSNLTSWTEAADVNPLTGSNVVLAVAAGPDGFVSAGSRDGLPVVWTTTDGRAWTSRELPVAADVSKGNVNAVAISGNRVVATGTETTKAGVTTPLAELFTAGTGWQLVPFGSPSPGTSITAVTETSAGFTAASQFSGWDGEQDAAVWTSATGASWTQSSVSDLTGGGSHDITALTQSGSSVSGIDSFLTQANQQFVTVSLPPR
jgi:serine/threonine protein kinase